MFVFAPQHYLVLNLVRHHGDGEARGSGSADGGLRDHRDRGLEGSGGGEAEGEGDEAEHCVGVCGDMLGCFGERIWKRIYAVEAGGSGSIGILGRMLQGILAKMRDRSGVVWAQASSAFVRWLGLERETGAEASNGSITSFWKDTAHEPEAAAAARRTSRSLVQR